MLFFVFFSVVLAQNDCYYAANKRAGSAIVPCSSGNGVSACCQLGDLCLADSACWNPSHNVTYLYGCTDSTYTDDNCPYKCGYTSAPYVGLDYCANTTRNEWSCTYPPSDGPTVVEFPAQECLNDSIIAFAGPVSLQPILSLASVVGGAALYFSEVNPTSYIPVSGYTPSTTASATASKPTTAEMVSTSSSSASSTASRTSSRTASNTNTSAAASTSTQTAAASESSGLSTGAKAGIGAGIGGAAIAIAAIVIAWMVLRRRKSPTPVKDAEVASASSTIPEKSPLQQGPSELASTGRKFPTGPSELPESESLVGRSNGPKSSIGASELPESESNFGTPAPTYTSWSRPQPGQQVYELPAQNARE